MNGTLFEIENSYYSLDRIQGVVVYQPKNINDRKKIGIIVMHSDDNYFGFIPGPALAERGYTVFVSNVKQSDETLDQKILDLKLVVDFAQDQANIEHFLLLGHSGGATLMSAYQAVAENGQEIFQDEHRIIKLSDVGNLRAADGIIFLDSNFGNGVMTLLSLEPGLKSEGSSEHLNSAFDLGLEEHGWKGDHAEYNEEFVASYQTAQAERSERLISYALERLNAIENGDGNFVDDEPLVIVGGQQIAPCNKLFPQDIRYISHTEEKWPLLHSDGSQTVEVVHSLRKPRLANNFVQVNALSTKMTTIKNYLTNCAVHTNGFGYNATRVYGIDWDSAYCNTPGNIQHIAVPTLILGMTGGYEFLASEELYRRSKSSDKSLAFVEGASHNIVPESQIEEFVGQYGDTVKICFDYVTDWIEERFG